MVSAPLGSKVHELRVRSSSISLPTKNPQHVPDFADFKLDPLQLDTDRQLAPHRLRETRRAFALYLEPIPGSPIQQSLKEFQESSFTYSGPNHAHGSTPHIAILDPIYIERGSNFSTKWRAVDEFIAHVQDTVDQCTLLPPTFVTYDTVEKPYRSLIMRFRSPQVFHDLAKTIRAYVNDNCSKRYSNTNTVTSSINRMNLAYNSIYSMPRHELKRLKEMARSSISMQDLLHQGNNWQLTLYEVVLESRVVGVQQQVKVVQSWPIPAPEKPQSNNLTSLRVRFSYWTIRFRSSPSNTPHRMDGTHSTTDSPLPLSA